MRSPGGTPPRHRALRRAVLQGLRLRRGLQVLCAACAAAAVVLLTKLWVMHAHHHSTARGATPPLLGVAFSRKPPAQRLPPTKPFLKVPTDRRELEALIEELKAACYARDPDGQPLNAEPLQTYRVVPEYDLLEKDVPDDCTTTGLLQSCKLPKRRPASSAGEEVARGRERRRLLLSQTEVLEEDPSAAANSAAAAPATATALDATLPDARLHRSAAAGALQALGPRGRRRNATGVEELLAGVEKRSAWVAEDGGAGKGPRGAAGAERLWQVPAATRSGVGAIGMQNSTALAAAARGSAEGAEQQEPQSQRRRRLSATFEGLWRGAGAGAGAGAGERPWWRRWRAGVPQGHPRRVPGPHAHDRRRRRGRQLHTLNADPDTGGTASKEALAAEAAEGLAAPRGAWLGRLARLGKAEAEGLDPREVAAHLRAASEQKQRVREVLGRAFANATTASPRVRALSEGTAGDTARLRAFLARLLAGERVTVVAVGGSVTTGMGVREEEGHLAYAPRIVAWLRALGSPQRPVHVDVREGGAAAGLCAARQKLIPCPSLELLQVISATFINAAVSATTSSYTSACVGDFVPANASLVLVEFSVNDWEVADAGRYAKMDNALRHGYERLLRKLLRLPQSPALLLLHWWGPLHFRGSFWDVAEDELSVIGRYYRLQSISFRDAFFQQLMGGEEGYRLRDVMCDVVHPNALGHRYFADLAIAYLQTVLAQMLLLGAEQPPQRGVQHSAAAAGGVAAAAGSVPGGASGGGAEGDPQGVLPPPMFGGQDAAEGQSACLKGDDFRRTVVDLKGHWEWVNDAKPGGQAKWGFRSSTLGDTLAVQVGPRPPGMQWVVGLGLLKSWHGVGTAVASCERGCSCARAEFPLLHPHHVSQVEWHYLLLEHRGEGPCLVRVEVGESSGGGVDVAEGGAGSPSGDLPDDEVRAVKVTSLLESEEAAEDLHYFSLNDATIAEGKYGR